MRDLLVATRNGGKLEEMRALLAGLPFAVVGLDDTGVPRDWSADEAGETFEGNALIKALLAGAKSGHLTISDDSGLEVEALNGAPGVQSARFVEGSDEDRYRAVLAKMEGVPDEKRGARFISVVALYDPHAGRVRIARGECDGHISHEPKGKRGFGYDPIFYVEEIGKTYAEATLEEKMRIDHRGKAMAKMRRIIEHEFV